MFSPLDTKLITYIPLDKFFNCVSEEDVYFSLINALPLMS